MSPPVSPQKSAPGSPADEIEENQAVEPLVSPQKLAPGSPADEIEENQAVVTTKTTENQAVEPECHHKNWHQVSSPVQLSSDEQDVFSYHEDGYNMYKNQPVVLLDHSPLNFTHSQNGTT